MIHTLADLDKSHADDEAQGQQLPGCEHILNTGSPAHTEAVHPGQQHWETEKSLISTVLIATIHTVVCTTIISNGLQHLKFVIIYFE